MNIIFLYKFWLETNQGSFTEVCIPYFLKRKSGELVWRHNGIILADSLPEKYKNCPIVKKFPVLQDSVGHYVIFNVKIFNLVPYEEIPLNLLLEGRLT